MAKKSASTLEVIKELKSKGNKVTYRKRTDGGYIITNINGMAFKGANGNKIARAMTGQYLTQKQAQQRIRTTQTRQSYYEGMDKATKAQLRKTQKAWREYKKSGGVQDRSRVSAKQVKRNIAKYGAAKAIEMLSENAKYAKGIAFKENVEELIGRIERTVIEQESLRQANKPSDDWNDILTYLKTNVDNIREVEQRQKILNALYDKKNKIHSSKQTGNAIRQILGIPVKA